MSCRWRFRVQDGREEPVPVTHGPESRWPREARRALATIPQHRNMVLVAEPRTGAPERISRGECLAGPITSLLCSDASMDLLPQQLPIPDTAFKYPRLAGLGWSIPSSMCIFPDRASAGNLDSVPPAEAPTHAVSSRAAPAGSSHRSPGRSCVQRAQARNTPVDPDHAAKMAKGTELFKSHVRGMLQAKCVKCHSGERIEGEFDMGTRESLLKGGGRGAAVVPGDHKKSLLWQLTAHQKEPHMPHERPKLADADIAKIAEWIDLGAPYDKPFVEKDDGLDAQGHRRERRRSTGRSSRSAGRPQSEARNPKPDRWLPSRQARKGRDQAEPAGRQADAASAASTST